MDQEVNTNVMENAPNIYELNGVDTKAIEHPLHNHKNPHLMHTFCTQK